MPAGRNTGAVTQYRAEFDAKVQFSNGGTLVTQGFRIDLPGPEVDLDEMAALFVASLGLLMVERVDLSQTRVFPEAHKGTRAGPSDRRTRSYESTRWHLVELSHVITSGMTTYPGPTRA